MKAPGKAPSAASTPGLRGLAALLALAVAAVLAFAVPSALAAYAEVGSFAGGGEGPGGSGSQDGQLLDPGQADVLSSSGKLYVADTGNDRVQVFVPSGATGQYDSQVAIAAPTGLAVDQTSGAVYVANATGIVKYDSALDPIALGWTNPGVTGALAVDPSSGDLLVADQAANLIRRFESDGTAAGSFAAEGPLDLAVNSSGEVFVVTSTGDLYGSCASSAVERFSETGVSAGTLGSIEVPGAVAVDPDDDSVLVATNVAGYNCGGPRPQIATFGPGGNFLGAVELGEATQYATVSGLTAVGAGSTRAFAVTKSPFDDAYGATGIFVLERLFPPEVAIDPVAAESISETAATVSGEVDPNGKSTEYKFEYRQVGGAEAWRETTSENAGEGTDAVEVSAQLQGLQVATQYEVRLAAGNADGPAVSAVEAFATPPVAPIVESRPAAEVTEIGARLTGTINPGGLQTTYYFEYGTSTAYGSSIPLSPSSIGTGKQPKEVSRALAGLTAGATYHFRLVAANLAGTTQGPDQTFTTLSAGAGQCANEAIRIQQGATHLPDCRAWEKVSPEEKGGNDIDGYVVRHYAQASVDGNSLAYDSVAVFGDASGGALPTIYKASRNGSGWSTSAVSPPQDATLLGGNGAGHTAIVLRLDPDLDKAIVRTNAPLAPGVEKLTDNLYLKDLEGGSYTLLTPGLPQDKADSKAVIFRDADPTFSHIAFQSQAALTPDAPENAEMKAYVYSDGVVRLASYLPGPGPGVPSIGAFGFSTPIELSASEYARNSISNDGTRAFFSASTIFGSKTEVPLSLRDLKAETTTTIVPAEPGRLARFIAASADGEKVYYRDTLEGSCLYEVSTESRSCIAAGYEGTEQENVLAADEDLTSIYQVFGEAPEGLNPLPNSQWSGIYHIQPEEDQVTEVARFDTAGLPHADRFGNAEPDFLRTVEATPDGNRLVFATGAQVTPYESNGHAQVYLYDAEEEQVSCISCPDGAPKGPAGLSGMATLQFSGPIQPYFHKPRSITPDGRRIFFESPERLLPADTNGKTDVYMWEEGNLSLLSSGRGEFDSRILDTSADGDNAFIITRERLLASDRDSLADVYVARVGGGFVESAGSPVPCEGDACQGSPPPPVQKPAVGSASFSGPGNVASRRCRPKAKRRQHGRAKAKQAKAVKKAKPCKRRGGRR